MEIGRLPYGGSEEYRELRDRHWDTHVFRFDERTRDLVNIAVAPLAKPLGAVERVAVEQHLLLVARAITRAMVLWLGKGVPIIRGAKDLLFWGHAEEAQLLTRACAAAEVAATPGLDVRLRYHIDCRLFRDQHD